MKKTLLFATIAILLSIFNANATRRITIDSLSQDYNNLTQAINAHLSGKDKQEMSSLQEKIDQFQQDSTILMRTYVETAKQYNAGTPSEVTKIKNWLNEINTMNQQMKQS